MAPPFFGELLETMRENLDYSHIRLAFMIGDLSASTRLQDPHANLFKE